MDKRKNYGIILDTETANTIIEDDGKLNMFSVLPYDIGFAIIDTKGNIYEQYSFVIDEVFCDMYWLMQSAYYAEKIPQYIRDLASGKRTLAKSLDVKMLIRQKCEEYGCQFVMAHNMRFDYRACNNLDRYLTKSKFRYYFPYGVEMWDTMLMAQDVICKMPTYKKFCEENGYMTANNQVRKTAEILYRFISGENDFDESHTGLEDVLIELEIYKYCKKQHKPMRKCLFGESAVAD